MRCPQCGLENPETASKCDCGHRFAGTADDRLVSEVRAIGRKVEFIRKTVLVFGLLAGFQAAGKQGELFGRAETG